MQGVGFRYTVKQIANQFAVTGWVQNLKDGRVELCAEGKEDELKDFYKKIQDKMGSYIQSTQVDWNAATNQYEFFEITHQF